MLSRVTNKIAFGIGVGVVAAFVGVVIFGERMVHVAWMGHFFLNALFMIVIPLISASLIVGIAGFGDVRKLGRAGGVTALYYTATTAISVGVGILLVNLLQPGASFPLGDLAIPERVMGKEGIGWTDLLLSMVSQSGKPTSIIKSMAEMNILPVIIFSLLFGGVLTTIGEKGKPVIAFFEGLEQAMMKMVQLLLWIAPLGIFGMVASAFAKAGSLGAVLETLGQYVGTVVLGLMIHGLIVLPLILWFFGRRNPFQYLLHLASALLMAFSSASSLATLPLTFECVKEKAKVHPKAAGLVLPLGATVNMDGTALYEAVAAIFIAQAFGVELTGMQQVVIFITATLAAIGAAGIPQAGLVTMLIVLKAVGLPLEGVGLILAVDWLLDRFRTTVNVWGDSVGAGVVERYLPD